MIYYPTIVCASLALLTSVLSLSAQQDPATDARTSALDQELARATSSALDQALEEDGGRIEDLLMSAPKAIKWRISVINDLEYQSNANLDGNSGLGAVLYNPAIEPGMRWDLGNNFTLDVATRLEAGIYGGVDNQNFWGISGSPKLNYQVANTGLTLFAGPEFYHFGSLSGGGKLSEGIAAATGVSYGREIRSTGTYLFTNYKFTEVWSSPARDDRSSHRVLVGANQILAKDLFLLGYYEYRFTDYDHQPREDSRNTVGLGLIWDAQKWLTVRLNFTFIDNDSTLPQAQFQTLNSGLGSAVTLRF